VRTGRFICTLSLGLLCIGAVGGSVASAAPGDIDRTFGREGSTTLPNGSDGYLAPNDMVIGPDDAIYVLRTGTACRPFSTCFLTRFVSRFDANGRLDASFGQGGTSTAPGGEDGSRDAAAFALGSDGKIIVASASGKGLVLARLDPDGGTDRSFGNGGSSFANLGAEVDRVRVAIAPDGGIVVAAESGLAYSEPVVFVARYTPNGFPDPTFHGGAPMFTTLGSGFGGFDLDGRGRILVAGPHCCPAGGSSVHISRFDTNGAFDQRFAPAGQRFIDDVAPAAAVGELIVRRDGRIVVVGAGRNGHMFALRLRGGLDRRFGNRGITHAKTDFTGDTGAALDRHGRIVIIGASLNKRSGGFLGVGLLRRLADGRPDRSFGGGGTIRVKSGDEARFVAVGTQSDDGIVVLSTVGECMRSCVPPKTTLIRYVGGSSGARCFGRKATIVGTRNGDRLIGTRQRDVIAAQAGNDVVRGRGGNDLICGGRGNDRLLGGGGRDRLLGGAGRNQIAQ